MEALALGIPVITTKAAGFHGEMLENGKNVLFCERTAESIKYYIEWLRKDKTLYDRMRIEGRKFAEQYHDIRKVAREYEKVIQSCYEANKNRVVIPNPNKGGKVKVKALKSVFLDGVGKKMRGEVFDMPEEKAIRLNGIFVEIVKKEGYVTIKPAAPVKKVVAAPARDKMIREPVNAKQEIVNPLKCPVCGFIAKTQLGLAAHMRKHKKK